MSYYSKELWYHEIMKKIPGNIEYIVGIDEVGRGPVAGPVTLAGVMIKKDFYINESNAFFDSIKDSKKLSEKKREEWVSLAEEQKDLKNISYSLAAIGPSVIDKIGITKSIRRALRAVLEKLDLDPVKTHILLDGGLYVPDTFIHQETIIKGDEKEPLIALASIVAKVTRDREMIMNGSIFPHYGFEKHKGYGTKAHYAAIERHGLCAIHRKSFLKRFCE